MIGLALSGGGVKGSYQIGAYLAFKKCGIKFNGIVGTSIGAFNGALLACDMHNELLNFWQTIDVGKIFNFDEKYLNKIKMKEKDIEYLLLSIDNINDILNNKGISIEGLQRVLVDFDLEKKLRQSEVDYGLSTYRVKDSKALDIFIDDIPKNKLNNYILASCYLPIFKPEKLMDDSFFLDGGIHNYCPVDMLLKKGYDRIYAIDLKAIGIKRKVDESKVITISPSRKISSMITLDQEKIKDNINLGYYDTLKVLKNYDGYKYIFKSKTERYYNFITRKMDNNLKGIASVYYKTTSNKVMVLKALEELLKKDKSTYFNIYKVNKLIKKYKEQDGVSIALKVIKATKCI